MEHSSDSESYGAEKLHENVETCPKTHEIETAE